MIIFSDSFLNNKYMRAADILNFIFHFLQNIQGMYLKKTTNQNAFHYG